MAATRKEINDRIEAYAKAVRERNAEAVSRLFAERFRHMVHGEGTNAGDPWNTKRETDREGIRRIYEGFFAKVERMTVEYSDRVLDTEQNAAAMVVRVQTESARMENALYIRWNEAGEIITFTNWYGRIAG
ncbi:MAG: nuclear transport factor 2 family protein [Thermodesulfobacteriota bacterium]